MTTTQTRPEVLAPRDIDDTLNAFLADPIGFGAYDDSDPITLDEFVAVRHFRGTYVAPLAF